MTNQQATETTGASDKTSKQSDSSTSKQPQAQMPASLQQSILVQSPGGAASSGSSLTTSGNSSKQSCETVSFHLKSGIFTRLVSIDSDKMGLGIIKQLAIAFLNEIYFQHSYPSDSYIGAYLRKHYATNDNLNQLYDRIILRLYNPSQDSFVPFYSVADIQPDSYISIEISERQQQVTTTQSAAALASIIVSSGHQYHHADSDSSLSHHGALSSSVSSSNYQLKISHDFHSATYIKPTYCSYCSTLILGVYKQGYQCNYCKKNYCPKCKNKAGASGEACLAMAPPMATGNSSSAASASPSTLSSSGSSSLMANASNLLSPKQQQQQQQQQQQAQQQSMVSNSSGDSGASSSSSSSVSPHSQASAAAVTNGSASQQPSSKGSETKLDISNQHANMSKRKSASNLLHFNIANPFKSHHNSQTQQSTSQQQQQQQQQQKDQQTPRDEPVGHRARAPSFKSIRSSAGALDPILQQLSKQMQQQQQQQQQQQNKLVAAAAAEQQAHSSAKLLNVQAAQLSSSHQNLYTMGIERERDSPSPNGAGATSGSSSAHQSPNKLSTVKQLSNSARHSARDVSQGAASPTRRDQVSNHSFISMDWIQLYGEPLCGVCNKLLKTQAKNQQQPQQQAPLSMCKTCKLQVHAHCQDLALADCLSRITESSRAAAETQAANAVLIGTTATPLVDGADNQASGREADKSALKSTNSNASRDNIRLHRLGLSVKHMKRPDLTKPIIEGWLQHKTLSDEQPRRHYWRLDETDITLYESDTSPRYFKAIALAKITRVISASALPKQIKEDVALGNSPTKTREQQQQQQQQQTKSANTSPLKTSEFKAQMESMFAFEVTTGSVYLVQASDQVEANRWKGSLEAITAKKAATGNKKMPATLDSAREQQENKAPTTAATAAAVADGPPVSQKQPAQHQRQFKPQQVDVDKANELQQKELQQQQLQQQQQQQTETTQLVFVGNQSQDQSKDQSKDQQQAQAQVLDKRGASRPHHHHHGHHHQHHYNFPVSGSSALRGGGSGGQQKTYTDPNRSRLYNRPRKVIKLDPMSIPDHWIEGKYLIERNRTKGVGFEELGSGQFGKVYAAVSEIKAEDPSKGLWSGVPVAIKEISKARFDLRQQAKLKNEANILSRLDHPGVIILERVHDLPDKLYIVMEQLEDDMLEMIVSTEEKRLNERVTKFLTYQILEALKYLHSQNIAHCDLKPENVLLCEQRSQFPQIKLCDFGFAKIIEENSFRSSLVGTPAYLAPEVVKGERYNRSVDLWSVGVIVYVSLSGEFPFNEGENIHDQISRANFMYPDQPWAKISAQAKSFINSLLRVNSDKRLSASRAQMDAWLQDYQLWCDLCELELRLGRRWVTDDADFGRWSQYAKQRQLQVPRAALQLHQELASGGDED